MKKSLFWVLCGALLILAGCAHQTQESCDLSSLAFVNIQWERQTEACTEMLCFRDDGDCSYYCVCGNPVNDDDLCEGYRYDPESKTIYLEFCETTADTVTEITVEHCDGQTLVLDFDGEKRTFQKAEEEGEFPLDELTFDGETYRYLQFPGDIFYYDLRESVDYEEDTVLPIPHERWKLVYHEGDLFVEQSQWEMAVADYGNDENYTWTVLVEDPETEEPATVPLTVSGGDISFVYGMEDMKKETTLFFEDIELFGTLVKTHKDGLIDARTSLAFHDGSWYWRSETIDDSVEGWPEYVVKLPDSLAEQIALPTDP